MNLDRYVFTKEIFIDDAGWGDLILGVVIGALKLPEHKYMERRIPISSFQSPNFENKKYLDDAVKIAEEIIEAMQPDKETRFKICSGYVLSQIRQYLRNKGFRVEESVITGELQERLEKGFVDWCVEVGMPSERLQGRRSFRIILEWIAERIELREKLVKTGWKSWQRKWRDEAYRIHLQKISEKRQSL